MLGPVRAGGEIAVAACPLQGRFVDEQDAGRWGGGFGGGEGGAEGCGAGTED